MSKRRQRGEGGLFQRADGQWVGRIELGWRDGKRQRRTVYGKTMAEAQTKLRKAREQVAAGNRTTAGTPLAAWLRTWLDEIVPGKAKMTPNTWRSYDSYSRNYLMPCLGKIRLADLAARHVRELHRYVMATKGLSATTAGHAHAILSAALNDAIRDGLITTNPCELVDHPKGAMSNTRRALTMAEVQRIFAALDLPRWRYYGSRWLAALLLGLRQGECLGLRWDRYDEQAGTLTIDTQLQRIPWRHGCVPATATVAACGMTAAGCPAKRLRTLPGYDYEVVKGNLCLVTPKTESSKRVIPVPEILARALQQHSCDTAAIDNAAGLIWTMPDGSPIEPTDDREEWHALLAQAGVPDTDEHSARHTTSTLLLALGINEDVRMAILGHSTAAARKIYSHVDIELARRAMLTLESAIVQPGAQ
jgi:integrase